MYPPHPKANSASEYAPEIGQQPFLMDGSWPHGLDNFTDKYKFTLAIGAPWACEPIPELVELVAESKLRYEFFIVKFFKV